MGKKGRYLLCAEGGEDWGYGDEAVPQSETGALDGGSLTHWDLSGAGGDGGYKGLCRDKKDLPEIRGSGQMELRTGSQPRLSGAEDDFELPAFYLSNAGPMGICCQ